MPPDRGEGRARRARRQAVLARRPAWLIQRLMAATTVVLLLAASSQAAMLRLAAPARPKDEASKNPAETAVVARQEADYIIGDVWRNGTWRRAVEVNTEGLGGRLAKGDDSHVRKLIVPTRPADIRFLRQLDLSQLQVDLWPHRDPTAHVHVRVQTSAIQLPSPNPQPSRLARLFGSDGQTWLTLFEAIVQMPRTVSLMHCKYDWRWADLNETKAEWQKVLSPPIRVLEVTCPFRSRGFLMPGPIIVPPSNPSGHREWRDVAVTCFRMAFVAILILVCVAQVVLLMGCIEMLVMQIGMQWRVVQ